MTTPRRAAMRRGRDQCWGFFTAHQRGGDRWISVHCTEAEAAEYRKMCARWRCKPGPIFKITGPRLTRTRGKGRK